MNSSAGIPELAPRLLLGTSSFTANGWQGTFYPRGLKTADYLTYYAEHFSTVEIDATFYACPAARTVANWEARVPEGFVFSVKAPQVITHEKILRDCGAELSEFLKTMDLLGPKLGPIVLQFPYFGRAVLPDRHAFTDRLVPFLKKLPGGYRFAVEIRNAGWLDAELCNLLRDYRVALVLQDRLWMSDPATFKFDPITAEWTYIRWLGDRKWVGDRQAENEVRFDKEVIDRTEELSCWVDYCYRLRKRGVWQYGYANNHYSGYAPGTIAQFRRLWREAGHGELVGGVTGASGSGGKRVAVQGNLFG
jgi:uncharacterized protein YecE (DUF72 family)